MKAPIVVIGVNIAFLIIVGLALISIALNLDFYVREVHGQQAELIERLSQELLTHQERFADEERAASRVSLRALPPLPGRINPCTGSLTKVD